MLLRHKLNLVAVGYCGTFALLLAAVHQLGLAIIMFGLAYFNWAVVIAYENREDK